MKPSTQTVLNLLISQGSAGLTPLQAERWAHTMRLAARIAELRAMGYVITTYTFRASTGAPVARYVLRHPEPVGVAS